MKVKNMTGKNGNSVPNQFIIETTEKRGHGGELFDYDVKYFQSYNSIIIKKCKFDNKVYLDKNNWDYSRTTGKYRNQFLGETKKETQAKIDSGEYVLTDLN